MNPKLIRTTTPPVDDDGNLLPGFVQVGENLFDCECRAEIPADAEVIGEGASRYDAVADDETVTRNQWFGEADNTESPA